MRSSLFLRRCHTGGYFACSFGADAYDELCLGICLINSAGRLVDEDPNAKEEGLNLRSAVQPLFKRWRWMRMAAGRFLLRSLQGRVDRTLNAVYPACPLPEDSRLANEIMRASYDYGAAEVIASGLVTPAPRSLADLLRKYTGPLLVFNGLLDPLGDVRMRTKLLEELYPTATIVAVEAG